MVLKASKFEIGEKIKTQFIGEQFWNFAKEASFTKQYNQ